MARTGSGLLTRCGSSPPREGSSWRPPTTCSTTRRTIRNGLAANATSGDSPPKLL